MKKIINVLLFIIFPIITINAQSHYDLKSKIEIDAQRELFKINKVKEIKIIDNNSTYITKIDRNGKFLETNIFSENIEVSKLEYKYDNYENLIEETYFGLISGDYAKTIYVYDKNGNIIEVHEQWGYEEDNNQNIILAKYEYNEFGNLIRVLDSEGNEKFFIEYLDNLKSVSYEKCRDEFINKVNVKKFIYNSDGLLIKEDIFLKDCKSGEEFLDNTIKYMYNNKNLLSEIESIDGRKIISYKYY